MTHKATVISISNPFDIRDGRVIEEVASSTTLQAWVDTHTAIFEHPVICIQNGKPMMREEWGGYKFQDNDIVVFFRLPLGGGDGGGKNIGLALTGLAVMAAGALYATGVVATALIGTGAAMAVVGSGLLGVPSAPSPDQANQLASPSPTYSLSAQGNTARIGQAIPVLYGRHKVFPDFAINPYSDFINNTQVLYQLFVVGQGYYDIETIFLDDTKIDSLDDISYEIIEPGSPITLFSGDVVAAREVDNQKLSTAYLGPFVITNAGKLAYKLAVDIILPKGLYTLNDNGELVSNTVSFKIEYRQIDDYNNVVGDWVVAGHHSVTGAVNSAIRNTYTYDMETPARYQIRASRTTPISVSSRTIDDIHWVGAKAYIIQDQAYDGLTLIAIKMIATDRLSNQASRKVNCIATRKLRKWAPSTGWGVPETSSSICWAVADMLTASYGGNLDDSKLDLLGFYNLDAILSDRNDQLNAVYDRKISLWEAIKLACRVGRCAGILQGGVFRIIRDRQQAVPAAMFSANNIVKNSLTVRYAMPSEDTVDGITVEYINPTSWRVDEVSATATGGTPEKPATVKLFGCTNYDQALREAKYLARNNLYRRKTIELTTELEGYIPTFGDLVVVSHDLLKWNNTGFVTGLAASGQLTLSNTIALDETKSYYIAFKARNGSVNGPWTITQGDTPSTALIGSMTTYTVGPTTGTVMVGTSRIDLHYGTSAEQTSYTIGEGQSWVHYGVVKSIKPKGNFKVGLTILVEDNRTHED